MIDTLLSPPILFFMLGVLATLARVVLPIPETVGKTLAVYLMMAIGLKGGVALSEAGVSAMLFVAMALGGAMSALQPFIAYALVRLGGRVDVPTAASIAGHYGSVSVVTFLAATSVLQRSGIPYDGYMPVVLAIMETPAIATAVFLAVRFSADRDNARPFPTREVLLNGSVILLLGAFAVGLAGGKPAFATIAPVFEMAFPGVLCLFLLDMGIVAARRLRGAANLSRMLFVLAFILPLIGGMIGLSAAALLGFSTGTTMLFGTLGASASYIAAPAALRLAIPEADAGTAITLALGLSFPFNIILGLPLYLALAQRFT